MLEEKLEQRKKNAKIIFYSMCALSLIGLAIDLLNLNFDNLLILLPLACMVVIIVCYVKNRNLSSQIQAIRDKEGIKMKSPAFEPMFKSTVGKILLILALLWIIVSFVPGNWDNYPVMGHVRRLGALIPFWIMTYTIIQDSMK